jgi:hypothetical protein
MIILNKLFILKHKNYEAQKNNDSNNILVC